MTYRGTCLWTRNGTTLTTSAGLSIMGACCAQPCLGKRLVPVHEYSFTTSTTTTFGCSLRGCARPSTSRWRTTCRLTGTPSQTMASSVRASLLTRSSWTSSTTRIARICTTSSRAPTTTWAGTVRRTARCSAFLSCAKTDSRTRAARWTCRICSTSTRKAGPRMARRGTRRCGRSCLSTPLTTRRMHSISSTSCTSPTWTVPSGARTGGPTGTTTRRSSGG